MALALIMSLLAPAAAAADTDSVVFIVPEAIYLAPDYDSYVTSGSYAFQWYVNNSYSDGTVTADPWASATGNFRFQYAGASQVQFSYEWIGATGGSITIDNTARTPNNDFTLSGPAAISAGVSPAMAAEQTGLYIRWTARFTDSNDGLVKRVQAYTYVYKPYVQPVGTALRTVNDRGSNTYGGNLSWISGVHGTDASTMESTLMYPKTVTSDSGFGFLPFSSAAENGLMIGSLFAQFASEDAAQSRFRTDVNNYSAYNWLSDVSGMQSTVPDASVSYQNNDLSGHTSGNDAFYNYALSPYALLTVDSSRYSNLSQIPNLSVGMMVTDDQNCRDGAWFVSDYRGTPGAAPEKDYYKNDVSVPLAKWIQYRDAGPILAAEGNYQSETTAAAVEGVKYNGRWTKEIPADASTVYLGTGYMNDEGGDTIWNISELRCRITPENKSALRAAVLKAIRAGAVVNSTTVADENKWSSYNALYTAACQTLTKLDAAYTPAEINDTTYPTLDALAAALSAAVDEFVTPTSTPSTKVTFAVPDIKARAGQTVQVAVQAPENSGMVSALMKISYDNTKLRLTGAENGRVFGADAMTAGNDLTKIPYTVLWADANSRVNITATGTIVTFTFEILEGAPAGVVPLTLSVASVLDVGLNAVEYFVENGSIEIKDCLPGDAGGDGEVDLRDVIQISRFLTGGWDVEIDEFAADVDADGEVLLKDAVLIRRYLAGWEVTLR